MSKYSEHIELTSTWSNSCLKTSWGISDLLRGNEKSGQNRASVIKTTYSLYGGIFYPRETTVT